MMEEKEKDAWFPESNFPHIPRKCKYANLQQICTSDLLHIHKFMQNTVHELVKVVELTQIRAKIQLKGPKHEIFEDGVFTRP